MRNEVGFSKPPIEQTQKALANGLFSVVAQCNGKNAGMGRLVGDGIMYWYIQDVAVLPEYQGQGIGKAIVKRLMQYIEEHSIPGTYTTIGLMAAKNKDGFYEKLGFKTISTYNQKENVTPVIFNKHTIYCQKRKTNQKRQRKTNAFCYPFIHSILNKILESPSSIK